MQVRADELMPNMVVTGIAGRPLASGPLTIRRIGVYRKAGAYWGPRLYWKEPVVRMDLRAARLVDVIEPVDTSMLLHRLADVADRLARTPTSPQRKRLERVRAQLIVDVLEADVLPKTVAMCSDLSVSGVLQIAHHHRTGVWSSTGYYHSRSAKDRHA